MKQTGIWLDKNNAHIVTINEGVEEFNTISSNIEHYHVHGGSGTPLKGGPQDVVQDSKYLERKKHQLKQYFNNIIEQVKDADELVVFGPAQTREKFSKALHDSSFPIANKIKGVKKADSMTDNQIKAWVRDFFNRT